MPHTISELLENKPEPLTVGLTDKATTALQYMTRHDYSQLPVIDGGGVVRGLITYESIMQAIRRFGCTVQNLQVSTAMVRPEKRSADDDLFDLLPVMERTGSVLIVDAEDRLLGIITSYDVMAYFRSRAENMMLVEDIETGVRDLILYAFGDGAGGTDTGRLEAAITAIDSQREELHRQFRRGLANYLQSAGLGQPALDPSLATQSFQVMAPLQEPKEFDQLTLGEFIELLCSKDRWANVYQPLLGLDAEHVRGLLGQVREIRNGLAHFRTDVTAEEHDLLRFCADWLSNHTPGIPVGWPVGDGADVNVTVAEEVDEEEATAMGLSPAVDDTELSPTPDQVATEDEMIDPGESRYARLAIWLSKQPGRTKEVPLKFDDIESIIGGELPPSARQHRAWWANDAVAHVQSKQWLDAGWRVSYISLSEQRVRFVRTKGRESAYIAFFSNLVEKVHQDGRTPTKGMSPDGSSWYVFAGVPVEGREVAWLNASFTRGRRLRIELYIDTGDQAWNKRAFDLLHAQAEQIEAQLDEELSWERLDHARASRIACYHDGSIMDAAGHEELQVWAVEALASMHRVVVPLASEALKQARGSQM
jgi:CBS domain-containing protein